MIWQLCEDGQWWVSHLIMPLVPGMNLWEYVAGQCGGPVSPAVALSLLVGAASGLAAMHAQGFAHLDMKQLNVMVPCDAVTGAVTGGWCLRV